jgi:hypothetical protein
VNVAEWHVSVASYLLSHCTYVSEKSKVLILTISLIANDDTRLYCMKKKRLVREILFEYSEPFLPAVVPDYVPMVKPSQAGLPHSLHVRPK